MEAKSDQKADSRKITRLDTQRRLWQLSLNLVANSLALVSILMKFCSPEKTFISEFNRAIPEAGKIRFNKILLKVERCILGSILETYDILRCIDFRKSFHHHLKITYSHLITFSKWTSILNLKCDVANWTQFYAEFKFFTFLMY